MPSPARTADGPGIAGLTEAHRERWQAGLCTLQEIADELGVTRQTVHKALRRRGWLKHQPDGSPPPDAPQKPASDPKTPDGPSSAPGSPSKPAPAQDASATAPASGGRPAGAAPDGAAPGAPAASQARPSPTPAPTSNASDDAKWEQFGRQARGLFATLYVALLREAEGAMKRTPGKFGPTQLGAIARAVRTAHEGCAALGVMPRPLEETRAPETLAIRVYTPEEEEALRQAADTAFEDAEPEPASRAAPHSLGSSEVPRAPAPTPAPAQADASPPAPAFRLPQPLPAPHNFESWLHALAHQHGLAVLRLVARRLGHDGKGGREELVAEILRRTEGEPGMLRSVAA